MEELSPTNTNMCPSQVAHYFLLVSPFGVPPPPADPSVLLVGVLFGSVGGPGRSVFGFALPPVEDDPGGAGRTGGWGVFELSVPSDLPLVEAFVTFLIRSSSPYI